MPILTRGGNSILTIILTNNNMYCTSTECPTDKIFPRICFIFSKTKYSTNYVYIFQSNDDALTLGIDSVVAIPLEDWSLDLVTPTTECIKKDGNCINPGFPDAPDQVCQSSRIFNIMDDIVTCK